MQSVVLAGYRAAATVTIQPIPNRSVSIPKHGDQKVGLIGIVIRPPSARAANARSASAAVGNEIERENPENGVEDSHPSDTITRHPPMRREACITFDSHPGGFAPSGVGWGFSRKRINISNVAPIERW